VFVAGLGFSQLLFAWAAEDMKSRNWLACHRRMYAYYGGVPHVTVPDCLRQGVVKCHLYDPDLNEDYAYLAAHFATAIVPARVRRPRDKAIVEGLVKILSRYFRFRFRRSRFTSIAEINRALMVCVERINDQQHRRFRVSRRERFATIERAKLKPLPTAEFDGGEWKEAKLHPDCYVSVEGDYYSAPHIHRHKPYESSSPREVRGDLDPFARFRATARIVGQIAGAFYGMEGRAALTETLMNWHPHGYRGCRRQIQECGTNALEKTGITTVGNAINPYVGVLCLSAKYHMDHVCRRARSVV
jgi:hypothetical protein